MKSGYHFCLLSVFGMLIFSCSPSEQKKEKEKTYSLEIIDSVQVDYLGEMRLIDFDSSSDKYLLATDIYSEYLEVDGSGKILNRNKFQTEGINAVETALGLGYVDGKVTVLNQVNGYYQFEGSSKVDEISIPYNYQIFMFYPKLGVFKENGKTYFPSLWPETMAINMNEGSFYKKLYRLPIVSYLDRSGQDTLGVVRLPETSPLMDDQIHGFPIPVYTKTDNLLLLSMWIEPRFYIYQKAGDEYDFQKTVELNVPGWVEYDPVPADNPEQFFEGFQKKLSGNLTNIFQIGDNYLAVYKKGIPEEIMSTFNQQDPNAAFERMKKNPHYAAVFDKDFNQLAVDLPFPKSSHYPMVVNNQGELVVSKNGNLSETEDDGVVLYKLKLMKN